MAFKQENKKTGFTKITIGLASPDEIMQISSGEARPIVIFVKLLFILESFLKAIFNFQFSIFNFQFT